MRKTYYFIAIILLFFFCFAHNSSAKDQPRILFMPFSNSTNDNGYDALADAFGDLLTANFSSYEDVIIIDRKSINHSTHELSLKKNHFSDEKTNLLSGKMLAANIIISGGISKNNNRLHANAHIYNVETSQLVFSVQSSNHVNSLSELTKDLTKMIYSSLLNTHSLSELKTDKTPEENLYFMKGIGFYYNNLFDHAVIEFMRVLSINPDNIEAHFWLCKSYTESEDHSHADIECNKFITKYPNDPRAKTLRSSH